MLSGIGGAVTALAFIIKIAQNKQRKKLWIALGTMAALVLLLVLLWPKSHPEDNSKIQQVQAPLEQTQTQQVAQNQPQPEQPTLQKDESEAERKEDEAYRKCTTISGCDSYLRTYPHGRYEDKVRQKRSELFEDEAYKKCTTISGCQEYLVKYPNGRYANEVRRKLTQLEQKQAQQQTQTQQQTTQNTSNGGNGGGSTSTTGTANGHEWVDLGLPSGTLWATCNIGASKPEDYGSYFAWGEISTKSTYNWSTYKYANGASDKLTKYCDKSNYGNNGFTDDLTTLQSGDDPATANWGGGWQTPSIAQWKELLNNTTNQWTTRNGVQGRLFTSKKKGQTLFLPAAGYRYYGNPGGSGSSGYYWSSSFYTGHPDNACYLDFGSVSCHMYDDDRYYGFTVRPVRKK